MSTVIDLFTRKAINEGEAVPSDLVASAGGEEVDEEALIEQFRESILADFLNAVKGVEESGSIEDLDYWLGKVKEQVKRWPRLRTTGGGA